MQCAARSEGLLRHPLTLALVLAWWAASLAPVAAAQQGSPSPNYLAYRTDSTSTVAARSELVKKAVDAGLRPLEDSALDREGLLVFEVVDLSAVEKSADLFKKMERIPINEFRGVLSVPTGSFYLRFKDDVTPAAARKRVEALGFKLLTPPADRGSLLVVEGSKRPLDQKRELDRLKKLQQLLFVAPNDIPLRVPAQKQ
jgi:hypothetical protein